MKTWKMVGVALIAVPFVALAILTYLTGGWLALLAMFGSVAEPLSARSMHCDVAIVRLQHEVGVRRHRTVTPPAVRVNA